MDYPILHRVQPPYLKLVLTPILAKVLYVMSNMKLARELVLLLRATRRIKAQRYDVAGWSDVRTRGKAVTTSRKQARRRAIFA